jgi:hypothetical protein
MKKTIGNWLLQAGVIVFVLSVLPPISAHAEVLSAHGKEAIQQISTCINSEGKDTLNVLYLVDESGSLQRTDPNALRVGGLQASLEQFRNISLDRPYFKVNREIATFGDAYHRPKEWQTLNDGQLNSDLSWIGQAVPKLTNGNYTDWKLALSEAYKDFQQKLSPTSCNIMVWFTDGAIDVGGSGAKTKEALAQICSSDPVSGKPTSGQAIIDQFRNSSINIQGVLLKTDGASDTDKQGMTYFTPIVEGSGQVDDNYLVNGGHIHGYKCGSDVGAFGVVQTIQDPLDIIWFPVPFNCLATNGRVLPIENGKVTVDPGMTRFVLTTPSANFSLKNSGIEIANGKGAGKGDVNVNPLGQSNSIITVAGNIAANTPASPGTWNLSTSDPERTVFCGYLDLDIEIKGKTCYENESCAFNGRVSRAGRPVDFNQFRTLPTLSYGALKIDGSLSSNNNLNLNATDGSYSGSYSTNGLINRDGVSKLSVTVNVTTKSGYNFNISAIKDFAVVPPGLYPEINPNPILNANFKQGIVGKKGEALAEVTLKGPSRTTGEICLSGLHVRTDPLPKRIPNYSSSLDGKNLSDAPCFVLASNETKPVLLSIKNSQSANGTASGFINVVLKSEGKPNISSKLDIEFTTQEKHNALAFWLTFIVVMLIGFGLPLGLFYLVNALGSRVQLSRLSMATVPVVLTASGGFVNIKRKEASKSGGLLTYDDFDGLTHETNKVKDFKIGSEVLRGRAPRNPFGKIRAILTTSPGYVIVSSELNTHAGKGLDRNQTDASLNPMGKMHLALSENGLAALKKLNKGADEKIEPIEANLVALLGFNSADPNQEIEALNMKLASESGWLNNLLTRPEPPVAKSVTEKVRKQKKNKDEGDTGGGTSVVDDSWNNPSGGFGGGTATPTAAPKVKSDDWGSTSTGNSDWGSSPSSGSDWGSSSGGTSTSNDGW